ncbi:MAG: flagellar motor protein MotB [Elusimicrobiota bacterium]
MLHRFYRPPVKDTRTEGIWLTIYADLMTNLVLVFLSLYGLTVAGDEALAQAIKNFKAEQFKPASTIEFKSNLLGNIASDLKNNMSGQKGVMVNQSLGDVRIEFGEKVLFDSAQSELKASSNEIFSVIAQSLVKSKQIIIVEGHSDSVPIRSINYKDNWELSMSRALSVVNKLIELGIPSEQIAAAAYGPYKPRASNQTNLGRRMNRRVEIVLYKEFPYVRK